MSLHEFVMRRASLILFWVSVLLFIGGAGTSLLQSSGQVMPYGTETGIGARQLFQAIVEGLSFAVWPFVGAGLIWTLKQTRKGAGE